jgi:hypothetical protein
MAVVPPSFANLSIPERERNRRSLISTSQQSPGHSRLQNPEAKKNAKNHASDTRFTLLRDDP